MSCSKPFRSLLPATGKARSGSVKLKLLAKIKTTLSTMTHSIVPMKLQSSHNSNPNISRENTDLAQCVGREINPFASNPDLLSSQADQIL